MAPKKVSDERILEFIDRFTDEYGYPPTFTEIAEGVGLSAPSAVSYRLYKLRGEGVINFKSRVARTVRRV